MSKSCHLSFPTLSDEDFAEFHQLFEQSSAVGATEAGGLHRLTASDEDGAVRRLFCDWLRERDFDVKVDAIGNIFGLLTWQPDAPYILCGSHLDSQPTAGKFDGCYGVVAAAAAARIVARHFDERQEIPPFNLCVVDWTNEEGARFQPSLTGSSVFTGALGLDQALDLRDSAGMRLGDALQSIGFAGEPFSLPVAAYAEIHVEQGRGLEDKQLAIGVVRSTWAASKWRVRFKGEQNHTGPTPMAERKDALLAAAKTIVHVREEAALHGLKMHTSVGKIDVYPNSPNVVPASVTMLIEFRSEDMTLLQGAQARFQRALADIGAQTGTTAEIESHQMRAATTLHTALSELALDTCASLQLPAENSVTVAGHDAISLSRLYPTCLTFVPSENGLSHNEAEFTSRSDMDNGLRFLSAFLFRLSSSSAWVDKPT